MCQCGGSWKKTWRLLLVRSAATLVQATGDSTGGLAHICRGDNTAEQIVNVPVPQILEQNVEVIKVILQEQCQRMRFFLLRACGEGCGQHRKSVLPHSSPHTRGLILTASDGIWNMLFSTCSHTSHWVRFSGCLMLFSTYFHTLKRARSNGCLSLVVAQASAICSSCLHRTPNCLLGLLIMCAAVSEEAASDIVRTSCTGPSPPDVTLDVPYWWQPGMPLLRPADYMAPVPLKRKRDTSADPKRDPAKRAYMRIPDEAKLLFVDFHAFQARVHGKPLAHNIRRAKLFGPVAPDTFRRWHDSGAPDHRGRPSMEPPPFALSRLANLTHAVAARFSLSLATWQHVCPRVLHELDIEFEPTNHWTRQFLHSLQLSWKLAATCTRHRPGEADIARERKLLQPRVIHLCDRYRISQDRMWNLDETAAHGSNRRARVDQKSPVSPCLRLTRLRHGLARCEHEGRHVDTDCL